jgi:PPOX class probable F420-dependent enzyme
MTQKIPDTFLDLFKKSAFGHLATIMADGTPQVTPVWVDYDGTNLLINTARGRQKDRNMQRNGMVAVEVQDPENPYRYITVRGPVIEISETGADEHIDQLAIKYTGEKYKWRSPGQIRVIYKINPQHVSTSAR